MIEGACASTTLVIDINHLCCSWTSPSMFCGLANRRYVLQLFLKASVSVETIIVKARREFRACNLLGHVTVTQRPMHEERQNIPYDLLTA